MTFIRNRTDVSEWLIHFSRDREEEPESSGEADFFGDRLEADANAYSVLKAILEFGGLVPTFAFRNGRATVYGGRSVVCFTEAPVYDFVNYVSERNQPTRCSHYGICVPKNELFAAGGRPAIYGVAGSLPGTIEHSGTRRMLDAAMLPESEQFRYVPYNPGRSKPLDWTHEREWRWVAQDLAEHKIWHLGPKGLGRYPALPLFRPADAGGFFSRVGFLVKTRAEAAELSELVLGYLDSGRNNLCEEYSPGILKNAFVIALDDIESKGVHRIEDATDEMRVIATRGVASPELLEKVRSTVPEAARIGTEAADALISRMTGAGGESIRDVCGGADVITYESTSEVTSALLETGLGHPMAGHYYVVKLRMTVRDQALSAHEAAANAAAQHLTKALNQSFHVRTWLD